MSTGKIIAGVLAGAALGASLGILFAPDKGSETRNRLAGSLKNRFKRAGDAISDEFDDIQEDVSNLAGQRTQTEPAM
jgi:gas vesicle protein